MDEAQAAVVDFKLSIFDDETAKRHLLAARYTTELKESNTQLPTINKESNAAYYPITLTDRNSLVSRLNEAGIESKVPFIKPLHLHDAFLFMHYAVGDFPVSETLTNELLLLPLNAYLTEKEQNKIITTLQQ